MKDEASGRSIPRRDFLAGLAAALTLPRLAAARARPTPPLFDNLVFVCIDDLNDWISCLRGHPNARTPNLDRIAAQGMLFTDCHAAAPICNPSRTATYFGMSPASSGVYFNEQDWRESSRLKGKPSIFHRLREAGLTTVGMGKIHHKRFVDRTAWDRFRPKVGQPRPPEYFPRDEFPGEKRSLRWAGLDESQHERFPISDGKLRRMAIETLLELGASGERFALNVGFYRPHLPWIVPQSFYDLFPPEELKLPFVLDRDLNDVPETGRRLAVGRGDHARVLETGDWRELTRAYLASIAFADHQVGKLFEAWETSASRDRTAFVLWSDNGWHLGEKTAWRKLTLWREATRVPLMIVAPGLTEPGAVCRAPVSLISLYSTLCDLIGARRPPHCEGPSLLPLLRDPESAWNHPAVTMLGNECSAVRTDRWCYIRYAAGAEEELYDRRRDPREFQNLAAFREPELKARLAAMAAADPAPYDPVAGSEKGLEIGIDEDD